MNLWHSSAFLEGFLAALAAGLFTGLGGFAVFFKKRYSQKDINMLLNIAAGVMLAAAFFALLTPAMHEIIQASQSLYFAAFKFCSAVTLGLALVWLLNELLPHEHHHAHHGPMLSLKKAWLFIIAISLHKLPEGLAVGVAYSAQDVLNPASLVIGIAVHNIPEGLIMAVSLIGAGQSKLKAALTAFGIGFVQPLGALLGLLFIGGATLIPFAMALAGGTLLFVVINEILPETYGIKQSEKSAFAVFLGFILMTYVFMVLE